MTLPRNVRAIRALYLHQNVLLERAKYAEIVSCVKGLRPRVEQEGVNAASIAPLTFSASTVTSPVHLPVSLTLVNSSTVTSPSLSPFGLSSFDASAVLSKRKLAGPIDLG